MNRPKNKKEFYLLIGLTLAVLGAIALFVITTYEPKLTKEPPTVTYYETEENTPAAELPGDPEIITTQDLEDMINNDEKITILSTEDEEEFQKKHLPHAMNIPFPDLSTRLQEIPRDNKVIVSCAGESLSCNTSTEAARFLLEQGYKVLDHRQGWAGWEEAGLPMMINNQITYRNIDLQTLSNWINDNEDFILVDIRDQAEFEAGHIPTAQHLPFENLIAEAGSLPKDKIIAVYDKTGHRSQIAVEQLALNNYTRVTNVLEGFLKWQESNFPTTQ